MYFPIYIDLSDKEVLIVGGGTIAARRIRTLQEFAGHMTVVAPVCKEEIAKLAKEEVLTLRARCFQNDDLLDKDLVLAATDDPALNQSIYEQCKEQKIPVNVCSDQKLCDFQFPSVIRDGEVVIGLNASGKDHSLVKTSRQKLERLLAIPEEEKRYND